MKKLLNLVVVAFFVLAPLLAKAGTHDLMHLQGVLTDPDGNPIAGSVELTLRIYAESSGGTSLWEETQILELEDGIYLAEIGSTTPFPDGLFDNDSLFLSLQIEGDSEMTPRLGLYSVPFAQQCGVAVTAQSLVDDVVTSASIAPGSITSSDIGPGAIGPTELASTSVVPGTYTLSSITVDADGRVTAAANGVAGGGGDITGVIAGAGLTGGGASGTVTLNIGTGGVFSAQIANDTITNVDINAAAAISDTKLDTIVTPGKVSAAAVSGVFADGQVADDLTINGGGIDNSAIGGTTPASGAFTNLIVDGASADGLVMKAFGAGAGETSEIRLEELAANGTDYVGFKAPDAIAANVVWVLPPADGTSGDVLTTNGAGVLSWASPSSLGSSIESSEITDGTIVDGDINAAAAIGWAKVDKTGAVPGDVGAAAAVHTHGAADIVSGELPDARVSDVLTIGAGSSVDDTALSGNVTKLGSSIESSEITDGTIVDADINDVASAKVTGTLSDGQVNDNLTIDGGVIDGTVIGGTTPAAGTFTTMKANTSLAIKDGVSGSEMVTMQVPDIGVDYTLTLPVDDGTPGQVLATDGSGVLSWVTDAGGDITDVIAGTGLTGGGSSGSVTLNADGPNITGLDAGNIATGTLDDARLSANVSLLGSSIESSEITDGTIVDADINGAAAIGWAKVDKTGAVPGDVGAASALHTHDAADVVSGTLDDARLSVNVSLLGSSVESSEITDGTIVDADVNDVAAGKITGSLSDGQVNDNLTIDGGLIDDTVIGGTVPAAGTFTTLQANTSLILMDGVGGEIVTIQVPDIADDFTLTLPVDAGTSGQTLTTDGTGVLGWTTLAGGDITAVNTASGSGLSGGASSGDANLQVVVDGSSIEIATNTVQVKDGGITNAKIVSVDASKITGTLGVSKGGTGADLSATGGANQFVKQSSAGGALGVGTIADADVPDNITISLAATATSLAANGTNCGAGNYALGVDASGNAEGCTVAAVGTVTSVGSGTGLTGGPITGSGTLSFDYSATLAGNPTLAINQSEFASTGLIFEGSSADTSEGLLTVTNPTADRTWTLPDVSGAIVTTGDTGTVTSTLVSDNAITSTDLAATLTFADGDFVDLSSVNASSTTEGLRLPQATSVTSSTAEGQISWDTDDDELNVGTGSGRVRVGAFLFNGTDTVSQTANYVIGTVGGEDQVVAMNMTCGNLRFQVDAAPDSGGGTETWAATVQIGGSDTSLTCTITEAATSCSDATNTTGAISAGNLLRLNVVGGSSPGANSGSSWSMVCYPDS